MHTMSNDYILLKLTEERVHEYQKEAEKERLARIALRQVKNVLMRPVEKPRFNQN